VPIYGEMASQGWSTQQLAEFLDLISGSTDATEARQAVIHRAAEALDAEVASVVTEDGHEVSIGFPQGVAPREQLAAVASGRADTIEVPGAGPCAAHATPIEDDPRAWLVVARSGGEQLSGEEMTLLRGLASGLAMAMRMLRGLSKERALRERSEDETRERKALEANYRNLVERLPAIVYQAELGEEGRWRYVSPQIEEILGFTPEEWMADPNLWTRQVHPDDRQRALVQENDKALGKRNPPSVDYRMLTKDGREIWILDEAVLERDENDTPVWHGVLYDITDRKGVEEELARRVKQQEAVASLGEQAMKGTAVDGLMDGTVTAVAETERIERSCIWEFNEGTSSLMMQASIGAYDELDVLRIPSGPDSPAGLALDSGRPVIVTDWKDEERFEVPSYLRHLGVRSTLSVVIGGSKRPFGVLEAHSESPDRFSPQDVHFTVSAANVLADAIERRVSDDSIRHRALHDPLTALPNRLLFVDRVEHALGMAQRRGTPLAVYFLDLDHFKLINDSLGHHTGDELLKAVAPRLRRHLRHADTVARFGGDEFAILVEEVYDQREAAVIADRIRDAFADPFTIRGYDQFISASIGVAVAGDGQQDAESLIRDADAAMYRAKDEGRNRTEMFDEAMRANAFQRLELERELRRALEQGEFLLHYQPIVEIANGDIVGVEALLRWEHPERGLVSPAEFVPVAEESGLIDPIGRWVMEEGCKQTLAWHQLRPDSRPVDLSVNLSARQFANRDLPEVVSTILSRTGLDAAHLKLEITESVLVEESGVADEMLKQLDEIGTQLVLDDFGTGYSSLAYLNRFPLEILKIDRSFVQGLGTENDRTAIVQAVIGMGRALQMATVAEGVENADQLDELRRLGCDMAQGFYFSRPMPMQEMTQLLLRAASRPPYRVQPAPPAAGEEVGGQPGGQQGEPRPEHASGPGLPPGRESPSGPGSPPAA
jgi:diguanylate cyclase (GGDEF)-like protein/PAS domain S-box-containing protein